MLFDLRGKRKRFIQVIYAALALLMGGGLVFFGIGSDASGGLADIFGGGSDGGSNSQFAEDADKLEERIAEEGERPALLAELVRLHYFAGKDASEIDQTTGAQTFTDEAFEQFDEAADAWDRYLATKPAEPNADVAGLAAEASFYAAAGSSDSTVFRDEIRDAMRAAQIVAEARPSLNSYITVARYAYYAGDTKAAEAAAKQAEAKAPARDIVLVRQALRSYEQEGEQITAQLAAFEAQQQNGQGGEDPLENPLGELSGGGGGLSGGGLGATP